MTRRNMLALTLALCGYTPVSARADGLSERLMLLIQAHKGKVAVAVKHLDTGEEFYLHADDVMPTASLIKTAVMVETYRQAGEKRVDLEEKLTLRAEDRVPGSGILTQLSPGLSLSLRDAVRLMMALSDNTATNLVLDKIGLPATAATMEKLGYPETKIHSKVFKRDSSVFPERSKQFGLGSTTARESIRLLEAIHKKQLVSPEACEAMLGHLRACQDADKFPRFLPAGVRVAFKSGSVNASRTAAGILYTSSGPVAVCVLTNENEDQRWVPDNAGDKLCAEVAREVAVQFHSAK
ncbi:MAG: serine hydrolase [Actinomycetota bacterium]